MVEVQVLIDNFQDIDNYNKVIVVKRNGKEISLMNKLLQKGDIYKITKERYKYLSDKKIVEKYKPVKTEDKGE